MTTENHVAVVKYRDRANALVEMYWVDVRFNDIVDGLPWRRFPWYLGQHHYSGVYWAATERRFVGYESRLELAHAMLFDFDTRVTRIVSQPFHLVVQSKRHVLRRTPDYLLMTDSGPRIVDVKPAERLCDAEVSASLALTREVVESIGCGYQVATEPDRTMLANVRFLAGYRRDWLFDAELLADIREVVRREREQSIANVLEGVDRPRWMALAGLHHLLWRQEVTADLTQVLRTSTQVTAQQ